MEWLVICIIIIGWTLFSLITEKEKSYVVKQIIIILSIALIPLLAITTIKIVKNYKEKQSIENYKSSICEYVDKFLDDEDFSLNTHCDSCNYFSKLKGQFIVYVDSSYNLSPYALKKTLKVKGYPKSKMPVDSIKYLLLINETPYNTEVFVRTQTTTYNNGNPSTNSENVSYTNFQAKLYVIDMHSKQTICNKVFNPPGFLNHYSGFDPELVDVTSLFNYISHIAEIENNTLSEESDLH